MKRFAVGLSFALLLPIACVGGPAPADTRAARVASRIPNGQWGGAHVSLEAADTGATLGFDCAHGSIPAPLTIGADGRFRLSGTFAKEHGGPIRIGEPDRSQRANYSGTIRGTTMTLSIELVQDQTTVGPFTLEFQAPGQIFKCR